jgi:hypothetical protein
MLDSGESLFFDCRYDLAVDDNRRGGFMIGGVDAKDFHINMVQSRSDKK